MGNKKEMQAKIQLDETEKNFINNLLFMTGDEIYQKHGYKRDETIINTAKFSDGTEIDVRLVICDKDELPYTEAVLFRNGSELACSDCEETYFGEWAFETEDVIYSVEVC